MACSCPPQSAAPLPSLVTSRFISEVARSISWRIRVLMSWVMSPTISPRERVEDDPGDVRALADVGPPGAGATVRDPSRLGVGGT